MSLDGYRERVQKLARQRIGEPIFNGSLEHAAIIVENMFAHASSQICILSGKMNARVYGPDEVLEQARLFLAEASHSVRILLEDANPDDAKDHPFLEEFADYKNVEVRSVPDEFQELYECHLLVMDEDCYRFEKDKHKHSAIAAFGDTKGSKNLQKVFNSLWGLSEPAQLRQLANQ